VRAHEDESGSMSVPKSKTTSGARKEGVPAVLQSSESSKRSCMSAFKSVVPVAAAAEPDLFLPDPARRCAADMWETPKSVIFTVRRSDVHMRLAGLMSR
jgi:hypothetical protein